MTLRRLIYVSGLFLSLCGLASSGCAKRETPAAAGLGTQTLLLGNGAEPGDLDPHVVTAYSDQNILNALFEGLTALDERTSQPVAAAAERWEPSADGLTWTFHLRPNLKWSDGSPLTAGDFVQSWRRLLTPSIGAENAYYLYAIKNAEAFNKGELKDPEAIGVAAPNERTLVVTLAKPTPYFAALTAQPSTYPVNLRVLEKFGAATARGTAWTKPGNLVGNGPFALKEWTPNARIVVTHQPHYWGTATVKLREIVFFPTENPEADERNFRAGQVHATFTLPLNKVEAWRAPDATPTGALRLDPFLQTVFLRFNTTKPPLTDPRVRRALSLAIDRETISRTVLRGSRAAALRLTPPGIGGHAAQAQVATDLALAKRLLAEAGFANGAGLPQIELQCRNDELQPQVAEVLQAAWQRDLGLRVTLARSEQKTWLQNQQTLAYTVTFGSWIADFPDASNFLGLFVKDGGYNWTGWSNPDYDRLLAEADQATNAEQRRALLDRAEALLLETAPIAPVFHGAQTYLLHPAVQGWPPSLLGTRRYQGVELKP
jgi:oligopeptide transport system substrate-binding protein